MILKNFLPVVEEIFVEDLVLRVVRFYHGGIKACNFFGGWRKIYISPYSSVRKVSVRQVNYRNPPLYFIFTSFGRGS